MAKIEEDLAGAAENWGAHLKTWIFVYQARGGLPPEIPAMLQAQQERYPAVAIDAWSSDALWEKARGLTLQQRCEILGPPAGYEHLFAMGGTGGREARDLRDGRILVVQDVMSPIDLGAIVEAIRPEAPLGPPVFVRPAPGDWAAAAAYQPEVGSEALAKGP